MYWLWKLYKSMSWWFDNQKDFPVPIENSWDLCIDWGHCVAICTTGAMRQRSMKPDETCLRITKRNPIDVTWS
jgi:Fe-S-cluster-containing hydrogenase component 2